MREITLDMELMEGEYKEKHRKAKKPNIINSGDKWRENLTVHER